MTLQEYLKKCNAKDVDALTDKQVADYIRDNVSCVSIDLVENGVYGKKPDRAKAYKLMRQSLKENKIFMCAYDDGESCCGPRKSGFDMFLV